VPTKHGLTFDPKPHQLKINKKIFNVNFYMSLLFFVSNQF